MKVYLQNPPTIRIGGQVTKSLYQFSMQSPDQAGAVRRPRERWKRDRGRFPGVRDVTSDLAITSPQVKVDIDRDKAAALQVSANAIESAFYDAYGPHWVSTIYAAINEYKVLLELEPQYQADPHALSLLYFKGTDRHADSAGYAGDAEAGRRTAGDQSLRAAAGGRRFRST